MLIVVSGKKLNPILKKKYFLTILNGSWTYGQNIENRATPPLTTFLAQCIIRELAN